MQKLHWIDKKKLEDFILGAQVNVYLVLNDLQAYDIIRLLIALINYVNFVIRIPRMEDSLIDLVT